MGSAIMRFNEGIIVSGSKSSSFPNRVPLYVSGSITLDSEEPTIAFKEGTGDRVTIGVNDSDNLNVINQSSNKYIVFKTNDAGSVREGFRIGGPVPEVVVNEGSNSLIDFRVESDNQTHMLFVDGGNDRVGIGTSSPTARLHLSNNSTDDLLYLETTEDSSTASPVFKMKRNSSSPADADYLGQIKFAGVNDSGNEVNYVKITGKIDDASDGSEDGILEFANIKAGSQTITARLRSDSLQLLNETGLSIDGGIGVGTHTPSYKMHVSADAGKTPNGISAYFRSADTDYSRIAVDSTANADTQISFMNNGSTKWSIGNEASGDSFYVSSSFGAFGNAAPLIIDGSTGTTMVESLTVARNSSSPYAMLESHGPAMFNMGNSATSGELYVMSSSAHSPPVLAVLPASGSVGVGAYEPQNTLTVSGSVAFSSLFIGAQNNPGSSYYVSPKDHVLLINTNGTAMGGTNSALDVFLPTAAKYPGMVVSIKDVGGNFGTNNVVVKRTGTDYVGHFGSTSQTLSSNGEYAQFMSNGYDSWFLMFKVS